MCAALPSASRSPVSRVAPAGVTSDTVFLDSGYNSYQSLYPRAGFSHPSVSQPPTPLAAMAPARMEPTGLFYPLGGAYRGQEEGMYGMLGSGMGQWMERQPHFSQEGCHPLIQATPHQLPPRHPQSQEHEPGSSALTGLGTGDLSPGENRTRKRRLPTIAQRRAANVRERRRMFNLNEAFDCLRRRVPTFAYERRLSRIETLRLAMSYISFMTEILNGKDPSTVSFNSRSRPGTRSRSQDPSPLPLDTGEGVISSSLSPSMFNHPDDSQSMNDDTYCDNDDSTETL